MASRPATALAPVSTGRLGRSAAQPISARRDTAPTGGAANPPAGAYAKRATGSRRVRVPGSWPRSMRTRVVQGREAVHARRPRVRATPAACASRPGLSSALPPPTAPVARAWVRSAASLPAKMPATRATALTPPQQMAIARRRSRGPTRVAIARLPLVAMALAAAMRPNPMAPRVARASNASRPTASRTCAATSSAMAAASRALRHSRRLMTVCAPRSRTFSTRTWSAPGRRVATGPAGATSLWGARGARRALCLDVPGNQGHGLLAVRC